MRWKIPLLDDSLPHQIRLVTDSWNLYVSCTCLMRTGPRRQRRGNVICKFTPGAQDPRVHYQRWHAERGIDLTQIVEASARG